MKRLRSVELDEFNNIKVIPINEPKKSHCESSKGEVTTRKFKMSWDSVQYVLPMPKYLSYI